ncbi:MAG: folylpolyglutamate synthase/dihydrofolate synthase family protein [Chloroflexota bacterium]|nr:folylpolyglutamate synthase/dihydrofolate synthase family protein [Chloroflexota bacterium]
MQEIDQKYEDALDFLYSFIDYSLKRNFRYAEEKFNLDRMRRFMTLLGDPQKDYDIIHIAGTKGKGSVSALCASVLKSEGYQVGLYTSPHMVRYTERIKINDHEISKMDVVDIIDQIKPVTEKVPEITTFELMTAMAFLYFSQQKVDYGVFEVGLGGRLDATNIVNPLVAVITSISYDHVKILGDTLSEIAGEKGGIIKENVPVIVAPQKEEARLKLEQIAQERNAPVIQVGRDYLYAADSHSMDSQHFLVWTPDEQPMVDEFIESGGRDLWSPLRLQIPLLGFHQVENAATAYAALKTTEKLGLKISQNSYQKGFSSVKWPGRMEVLHNHPTIVLDSAHNRYSALRLRQALDDYFPGLPVIMLFGASEDKDIEGMFQELLPRVRRVITTQSIHPRAIDAGALVELAHRFGRSTQAVVPIEDAFNVALQEAGDEAVILVTGSVFVVAAIRDFFMKQQKNQANR